MSRRGRLPPAPDRDVPAQLAPILAQVAHVVPPVPPVLAELAPILPPVPTSPRSSRRSSAQLLPGLPHRLRVARSGTPRAAPAGRRAARADPGGSRAYRPGARAGPRESPGCPGESPAGPGAAPGRRSRISCADAPVPSSPTVMPAAVTARTRPIHRDVPIIDLSSWFHRDFRIGSPGRCLSPDETRRRGHPFTSYRPRGVAQSSWRSRGSFSRLGVCDSAWECSRCWWPRRCPRCSSRATTTLRGLGWLVVLAVGAVLLIDLGDRLTEWVERRRWGRLARLAPGSLPLGRDALRRRARGVGEADLLQQQAHQPGRGDREELRGVQQ